MKKIALATFLTIILLSTSYANQMLADSENLAPGDYFAIKKSYLLTSGAYILNCIGGRGVNCNMQVSTLECPDEYYVSATTSVVHGGSAFLCPVRFIYLEPQPANIVTANGGYQLTFINAYLAGSSKGCGKYDVTINYAIYCNVKV